MRVDLPAPFWPTSAWTSPAMTRMETPSSARVGPKRLRMSRISSRGVEDVEASVIRRSPGKCSWAPGFPYLAGIGMPALLLEVFADVRGEEFLGFRRVDVFGGDEAAAGIDEALDFFAIDQVDGGAEAFVAHGDWILDD